MHIHTHAHTHTRTHAHTHTRTLSSSLLPCQLHAHLMPSGSHTLRSWLMLAARFLLSTCCGPTRCLAQSTTQSLCTSSLSCIAGKWRYKEQKEGKEGQGQEEEEETTRISYFYPPPPKKNHAHSLLPSGMTCHGCYTTLFHSSLLAALFATTSTTCTGHTTFKSSSRTWTMHLAHFARHKHTEAHA